jgi:hypothetical protein
MSRDGIGTGSAGTCFSGGSGSGGTFYPAINSETANAQGRGGAGTESVILGLAPPGDSAAGAGNPNGNTNPSIPDDPQYNGTGGVLIVFVEGTITTAGSTVKHFRANGVQGRQMTVPGSAGTGIYPFGGGTGGGIVILVNGGATGLTDNIEAAGGIVANNGPSPSFRSGGEGVAVAYTFGQL